MWKARGERENGYNKQHVSGGVCYLMNLKHQGAVAVTIPLPHVALHGLHWPGFQYAMSSGQVCTLHSLEASSLSSASQLLSSTVALEAVSRHVTVRVWLPPPHFFEHRLHGVA